MPDSTILSPIAISQGKLINLIDTDKVFHGDPSLDWGLIVPAWLWRSIVGLSTVIALVTTLQWASCRFYVLPTVWPWYAKYIGTEQSEKIDPGPMGCTDADGRSIAVLMGLLTTLISLSRNAE